MNQHFPVVEHDYSKVLLSPHKRDHSVYHQLTQRLLKTIPIRRIQKKFNSEEILKTKKFAQDFEAGIQQSKTGKQKDNTDDKNSTKENESN